MDKNFNTIRYEQDFPVNKIEEIRISKVLNMIGSGKKVLDIGCGDGFFMERIKAGRNEVVGVEVSDSAIKKARLKGFKVYDLLLDGDWSENIEEKFDVVFGGEIIEHIFDTDKFLQNIRKILKDDGYLVLTTPNVASLGRRMLLLFGNSPLVEVTARSYDAGHVRYFTRKTLSNLLAQNKFSIEKMESTVINFSNSGKLYSSILAEIFPSLGNGIIVKAKKDQNSK